MGRLFDDWFISNHIIYCCILVDRIINRILGVCTMIVKKTYINDYYIVLDNARIELWPTGPVVIGNVIDAVVGYVDNVFKIGEQAILVLDDHVEVLQQ